MKCAVFSCLGLGDGLITLVLSHNLTKEGCKVDTFHPFFYELQALFPHLPLKPFPSDVDFLKKYDRLFIMYEKSPWMQRILETALKELPEKTTVLNPIATKNQDYPFWEGGRFDGGVSFVENLYRFAKEILQLKNPVRENGLILPKEIEPQRFLKRIVIHPTSSRPGKNWSKSKFLKLGEKLQKEGYDPVFLLTPEEKKRWPEVSPPFFKNLNEMVYFVAESGAMIGNDSGVGHLASCLNLPTVIICRSCHTAEFWRPDWKRGKVIVPPSWIPNLKGMRLKDKRWQWFVPLKRVFEAFEELHLFS